MKFPIPSDLAPEIGELQVKEAALSQQSAPLRAERLELLTILRSGQATDAPPPDERQSRVAGLLGRNVPTTATSPRDRLREVDRELADIDAALAVLANDINAAHRVASTKARGAMDSEYRKRASALVDAVVKAHNANHALRSFVEIFEDAGFGSGGWSQLFPGFLGGHTDPNSPVAHFLRDCVEAGITRQSEIPTELQHV